MRTQDDRNIHGSESSLDDEVTLLRSRVALLRGVGIDGQSAWRVLEKNFSAQAGRQVFPSLTIPDRLPPIVSANPSMSVSTANVTVQRPDGQGVPQSRLPTKPLPNLLPKRPISSGIESLQLPTQDSVFELSFQYAPLIQCTFPHSCPDPLTSFSRRNGRLNLTISTKRSEIGLPYGVPARLLTMYITSTAVRTRSPEVSLGPTLQSFLRELDVPISRGPRGSLTTYANQLMRLIESAFTIEEDLQSSDGRTGLDIRQTLFAERARMWWDQIDERVPSSGSSLVLPSILYESMIERAAPLRTRDIKLLRGSAMDLDVYAWLVHRLYRLHKPSRVTWEQLEQQFGHNYKELRVFKFHFMKSLKRVHELYSEANITVRDEGVLLSPSRPRVERLPTALA